MKLVSFENLSKYNELLNQKTVRSVNSIKPDSNGNVTLEIPQAIGVTRFPDYEHPITVFDVVNKGFIQDVNFDYVFPEDGYFHYRLLAAEGKYYDAIIAGSLTVNGNVVDLYERSRSPSGTGYSSCINGLIPVPKGSALHIGFLQCNDDANNVIEFFPLKNGNATSGSENVSLLSPVHYSRSSNFETSGRTSIKLPSYLSLMVNGHHFRNDVEATVDISDTTNWDSTETDYTVAENRAGKDFYIYAVDNGATNVHVHIVLSANSTVPTGYTESSSRKIGGFHCLCADVGTPTWRNPATLKDEAHWLSGYVKGDILPYSVWDLLHRAESSNEGMVFSPETHMWYDIYLASWDGSKLVSVFGGTTADGASSKPFHGEMFAECAGQINKELISRDEFIVVAKGSNESTNIHGSADAGTTGGHVDSANRRMISNIGLEDCCGFLWQWCKQSGGANGSSEWNNSVSATPVDTAAGVYGQSYGTYYRARVGGAWNDPSWSGSRCVSLTVTSARVSAYYGAHLSSRERVVTGL